MMGETTGRSWRESPNTRPEPSGSQDWEDCASTAWFSTRKTRTGCGLGCRQLAYLARKTAVKAGTLATAACGPTSRRTPCLSSVNAPTKCWPPFKSLFAISSGLAPRRQAPPFAGWYLAFFRSSSRVGGTFPARQKTAPPPHRFGSTTKVCISLRFTTSTDAPSRLCTPAAKGFPSVTPVHQHVLHQAEAVPPLVKHRQSPSPVGDVRGSHVDRMGQSLSIHRDVALDSRHLLARVIALLLGAVRVLTLWESTMQKLVCSFRPLLLRAAPTNFF